MFRSCSGTLYHLEGWNLFGWKMCFHVASSVDQKMFDKQRISVTNGPQLVQRIAKFLSSSGPVATTVALLWTLNFDWDIFF